jgi:hypothetical protein
MTFTKSHKLHDISATDITQSRLQPKTDLPLIQFQRPPQCLGLNPSPTPGPIPVPMPVARFAFLQLTQCIYFAFVLRPKLG